MQYSKAELKIYRSGVIAGVSPVSPDVPGTDGDMDNW